MDKPTAIRRIEERADAARVPIYKLCERAGVAPSTITRWRKGESEPFWSTIGKLEDELSQIEREKAA